MKKFSFFFVVTFWHLLSMGQQNPTMTFERFFYQDGTLSSEGYMREGKPDGYWKSYYPDGTLRSEGNRKNFLLDSTWKFYALDSTITSEITYREGIRNGLSKVYQEQYVQLFYYKNDTVVGTSSQIDYHGHTIGLIPFVEGKEHGFGRFFDTLGTLNMLVEYYQGYAIRKEIINRYNANGLKQGTWKSFNDSNYLVLEGTYTNGKKNGFFKYYDQAGDFVKIEKYENDILIEDAIETKQLERKIDYHSNGKIRTIAHFYKGVPEGVRREYDSDGKVVKGYIFKDGIKIGEGIVDDNGKKQGDWKEFYPQTGLLRAKGRYQNGLPVGDWIYYYPNGKVELSGTYTKKGQKDGQWIWLYPQGAILSEENYIDGLLDGLSYSLSQQGDTLLVGNYTDGLETGRWMSVNDSVKVIGKYEEGKKEGNWRTYYPNGKPMLIEPYFNDVLDGRVIYYWENAVKKAEYPYTNGLLNGNVVKYDKDGNTLYTTTYKMGIEVKYEGVKVTPSIEIDFE